MTQDKEPGRFRQMLDRLKDTSRKTPEKAKQTTLEKTEAQSKPVEKAPESITLQGKIPEKETGKLSPNLLRDRQTGQIHENPASLMKQKGLEIEPGSFSRAVQAMTSQEPVKEVKATSDSQERTEAQKELQQQRSRERSQERDRGQGPDR